MPGKQPDRIEPSLGDVERVATADPRRRAAHPETQLFQAEQASQPSTPRVTRDRSARPSRHRRHWTVYVASTLLLIAGLALISAAIGYWIPQVPMWAGEVSGQMAVTFMAMGAVNLYFGLVARWYKPLAWLALLAAGGSIALVYLATRQWLNPLNGILALAMVINLISLGFDRSSN